jgi:hypothetical protein
MLRLPRRHLLTLLLAAMPLVSFAAPPKGGAANLAMIGEPQSLDPMALTANGTLPPCWPTVCPGSRQTV